MKTCKEMALIWNISVRAVSNLCKSGRIPGAVKNGKNWEIPDEATKPVDGRISSGEYCKKGMSTDRKSLPIGISDYVRAQSDYYYVDKTMLIKEFLDQKPLVSLFTRPRRFGKTLNMDMLRVYFEKVDEDTSKYFKDKNIWKCGENYRMHQGKYPVIFLTFKDVKFDSWQATVEKIKSLLQEEYGRHQELLSSGKISDYEKTYFNKVLSATENEVELSFSLEKLSKMLATHYDKAPIIIIDECDTPIQEGYSKDFYDEIIGFMRNFFSGAFKDNKNLSYGFLTGILRIAQESIFGGLNNLTVNSVMDEAYDRYFGFTNEEVSKMLEYYGVAEKESELQEWYDGYLFGNEEIYNPWSVINYISKGCVPQAYWVNTGKNEILEDVLKVADEDITEKLYSLICGDKVLAHLMQIGAVSRTTADKIAESLFLNDYVKLEKAISEYMNKAISFYDTASESFYHGLILGLISMMDNQYKIKSNRESGKGRFDIGLIPRDDKYPGMIMELKWKKNLDDKELALLADEAIRQINSMEYDSEMKSEEIKNILRFGIAFSGKRVCVKTN